MARRSSTRGRRCRTTSRPRARLRSTATATAQPDTMRKSGAVRPRTFQYSWASGPSRTAAESRASQVWPKTMARTPSARAASRAAIRTFPCGGGAERARTRGGTEAAWCGAEAVEGCIFEVCPGRAGVRVTPTRALAPALRPAPRAATITPPPPGPHPPRGSLLTRRRSSSTTTITPAVGNPSRSTLSRCAFTCSGRAFDSRKQDDGRRDLARCRQDVPEIEVERQQHALLPNGEQEDVTVERALQPLAPRGGLRRVQPRAATRRCCARRPCPQGTSPGGGPGRQDLLGREPGDVAQRLSDVVLPRDQGTRRGSRPRSCRWPGGSRSTTPAGAARQRRLAHPSRSSRR